ncbi:MAG: glycoside hydrolase family 108 protein, partial [Variibacter sp.]
MAASSYDECLRRLLAHEGGYSNHPADPGGPTNFGITLADVRRYVKSNATAQDVRALTVAQAKAIYRTRYWDALRGDALPAGVDYAVFDYGVNSGAARATRVLCALVGRPGTIIDDAALDAARARNAAALIDALCDERMAFLKRLKTWDVFGAGWSRRVAEVRTVALRLAAGKSAAMPTVAPSQGKGAVSVNTAARNTSTGGVIATGTVAAQQAHSAGATV